jgi:glycosyltransferase involved in cell wall biosynthesis
LIDISCVIPVFKEDSYLKPTLYELARQSYMFRTEIVLVEYNPDNTTGTRYTIRDFSQHFHIPIRLIKVFERGIPLARHEGIMAAHGPIICDFDADARWNRDDALQQMVDPIIEGEAVMTNCSNIIDMDKVPQEHLNDPFVIITNPIANFHNFLQRLTNYTIGDPGTCFLKQVYEEVGGFDLNNKGGETGFSLTPKILLRYPGMLKNIRDVIVIQSPRRVIKIKDNPNVFGQYKKAVRGRKTLDVDAMLGELLKD